MRQQRGGTFLGFVLGMVIGLAAALAVAVYVTKVPVPFVSKALSRDPDQDANEQQKNKGWNPNAPLYGKNPAKPTSVAEQVVNAASEPAEVAPKPSVSKPVVSKPVAASTPAASATKAELKPAVTADPIGDLVKARAAAAAASKAAAPAAEAAADSFIYFVQVGAFRTPEDAEAQRAKLLLAGIETKVSEREQSGRMVHRVRLGPFDNRDAAEKAKAKLEANGVDTALVRVQR